MNNHEYREEFEGQEINLRDYWAVLLKRRWMIIAVTLAVILGGGIITFTIKAVYRAKGTLLIEQEPNILSFEQIFQVDTYKDDFYQTQYKLLQSRSLADNTIGRLKLYENQEFFGKAAGDKKLPEKTDTVFRGKLVTAFLGRLDVKPVRLTRLVEVNFSARDPKLAADCVNALFDSFIDMNIQSRYKATEQATEFLTTQIAGLHSEIEQKEKDFQSYGAEKNIIALSDKETTIIDKLSELNKALTAAQIERVEKETYYNEIKIASPDYLPDALTNPLIQRLREDYNKLSREYLKKQDIFRPEYPEMKRLKTEIDSARESLKNETQNLIKGAYSDYQAAWKKEKSLEQVFNKQKQEAIQLNSNAISYNGLKIEIENKKSLLESLLRRQSETGVSARLSGLRTSSIKIVDRAEVPLYPSSPRKKMNMLLALFLGLFGGIGLAFLFEHLDNSVKTSDDVEKYAELPALGIVPAFSRDGYGKGYGYGYEYGHKKKRAVVSRETRLETQNTTQQRQETREKEDKTQEKKTGAEQTKIDKRQETKDIRPETNDKEEQVRSIELITYYSPKSSFSESYRSIRTALLLSSADPNLKAIVVSSPLPAEGKTATVSNLAVVLAQANKMVLVVDSDLRKPKQHKIFKIKNLNGLTNYLTAGLELKDLIKSTQVPNLFLINSGPVPPNPAELLGSEKMGNLIEKIKGYFNYILFDSPPILAVSDAMVMGQNIDGVILIVQGEKTSRETLQRAKKKLDMGKIKTLGVIINNLNIRKYDYYSKQHYYQYYGEQ
jgi:capsular exopolysaccharide synthesis family protein